MISYVCNNYNINKYSMKSTERFSPNCDNSKPARPVNIWFNWSTDAHAHFKSGANRKILAGQREHKLYNDIGNFKNRIRCKI